MKSSPKKYPQEFKSAIINKLINRGNLSVAAVCIRENVPYSCASRWYQYHGKSKDMSSELPKKWTPEEKLKSLLEFESLTPEDRGVYLRKHGLYSQQMVDLRASVLEVFGTKKAKPLPDNRDARIKQLEQGSS